jgi:ribosomal protein L36
MLISTILQRTVLKSTSFPMMFIRSYRTKDMLRRRCADCYVVWRYGRMYIECPKFARHKTVSKSAKEKGWGWLDWRLAPKLERIK